MPTPFTHLANARRLLADRAVPESIRAALLAHESAFLLGNIAADGHHLTRLKRDETHFYQYDRPLDDHPWRVMLSRHPSLRAVDAEEARAFLAGYVAHLCLDEIWWLELTRPYFALREWGTREGRFLMLNILLIQMDERDFAAAQTTAIPLAAAIPHHWLPFMDDSALIAWRDMIVRQIVPDGDSETLEVIAPRVNLTPQALRALVDDAPHLEADLYAHIARDTVAAVEAKMDLYAREQVIVYWNESNL